MSDIDPTLGHERLTREHVIQALSWIGFVPFDGSDPETSGANFLEGFTARQGPVTWETVMLVVTAHLPRDAEATGQVPEVLETADR
jgi:hypothetical protein